MLLKVEIPKFCCLFLFFLCSNKLADFLFALLLFLPLRLCAGGLHFKSNKMCFLISFLFFVTVLILLQGIRLPFYLLYLIGSTILAVWLSPVYNRYRPYSKTQYRKLKAYSACLCVIEATTIALFFHLGADKYGIIGFWIYIFHTVQLVIATIISYIKNGGHNYAEFK